MTLADDLLRTSTVERAVALWPRLHEPLHLAFNGQLSPDEWRLLHQGAFNGPVSWEEA